MKGILLGALFLFPHAALSAPIYQWTDPNGKIHYSDEKPENISDYKAISPSKLPHFHATEPLDTRKFDEIMKSRSKRRANLIKESESEQNCRIYRRNLEDVERRLNNRSVYQDRDQLWKLKNLYQRKVRAECD